VPVIWNGLYAVPGPVDHFNLDLENITNLDSISDAVGGATDFMLPKAFKGITY